MQDPAPFLCDPAEVSDVDLSAVRRALPDLALIEDARLRERAEIVWARLWRSSSWPALEEAPYSLAPEVKVGLVEHVHAVVAVALASAKSLTEAHAARIDFQRLLIVALLHDASKLVEYELVDGTKRKSELGHLFPHGVLGSFACLAAGLSADIAHEVLAHTLISSVPPHSIEGVILYYADMACSDLARFQAGARLHLAGHAGAGKI